MVDDEVVCCKERFFALDGVPVVPTIVVVCFAVDVDEILPARNACEVLSIT